jgi:hypothetical protein
VTEDAFDRIGDADGTAFAPVELVCRGDGLAPAANPCCAPFARADFGDENGENVSDEYSSDTFESDGEGGTTTCGREDEEEGEHGAALLRVAAE